MTTTRHLTQEVSTSCLNTSAQHSVSIKSVHQKTQALPPHITPYGTHYQISNSNNWWIGPAHATPEEVQHVRGIVLYNHSTYAFLTEQEARAIPRLFDLMLQDLDSVQSTATEGA